MILSTQSSEMVVSEVSVSIVSTSLSDPMVKVQVHYIRIYNDVVSWGTAAHFARTEMLEFSVTLK